jgi:ABC-type antimicrobial peptide transport system permease subunit
MRKEPFIIDVQPVETNNFDVSFETADKLVPRFRSDVFIQTVDPDFLDVKSEKWKWKEGDSIVPIIMPRDFLVMLNTFMSASGIPQVSDELAMDIKFKFTLSNETEKEWANVRIIGFTNEVSSILVPQSFMSWANKKYGIDDNQRITQVMISGKESEFGLVEEMLKKKHLESRNGQMVIGRLKSMVGTLILIVLGISIIAVFVSGLVLIQYLQLLLSKNTYEVRTLLRLGYSPKLLTRHFFLYFTKVFGVVALLSLISFVLFKFWLDALFEEGGLYIGTTFTVTSIASLLAAYGIFAFVSYLNAKKGIYRSNNG